MFSVVPAVMSIKFGMRQNTCFKVLKVSLGLQTPARFGYGCYSWQNEVFYNGLAVNPFTPEITLYAHVVRHELRGHVFGGYVSVYSFYGLRSVSLRLRFIRSGSLSAVDVVRNLRGQYDIESAFGCSAGSTVSSNPGHDDRLFA